VLGEYGQQQVVTRITLQQLRVLKHNYQAIITQLNKQHSNTNDLSMHLLTTLHLAYRTYFHPSYRLSMHAEAKEALQKTLVYIDNPHSDPVLRGICLNHLCSLYKSRGKLWKSLKYSLRGVEIVQLHLHGAKTLPKK
jgi:hypothetical protein